MLTAEKATGLGLVIRLGQLENRPQDTIKCAWSLYLTQLYATQAISAAVFMSQYCGCCLQIEFAAKEAFAAWALYGVLSRVNPELVDEWANWIPQAHIEKWISQQKKARKQMLAEKAVLLPHVREAEEKKKKRKSPSRTAKDASIDLLNDIAGDLTSYSVFDHDTLLSQTRSDAM